MRVPRIYQPQALETGKIIFLDENASHHISTVLRFKVGFSIRLFDGLGNEFFGIIQSLSKRSRVEVLIGDPVTPIKGSPLTLFLGQGISRQDRMDYAIQKAVELGTQHITPLITEYCQFSEEHLKKRLFHWKKIIINACEQSGSVYLPTLYPPTPLCDWVKDPSSTLKLVLDPKGNETISDVSEINPCSISLLIGPEGGLSEREVNLAAENGYRKISLGPRILRTETATLAMITILQSRWGDMSP